MNTSTRFPFGRSRKIASIRLSSVPPASTRHSTSETRLTATTSTGSGSTISCLETFKPSASRIVRQSRARSAVSVNDGKPILPPKLEASSECAQERVEAISHLRSSSNPCSNCRWREDWNARNSPFLPGATRPIPHFDRASRTFPWRRIAWWNGCCSRGHEETANFSREHTLCTSLLRPPFLRVEYQDQALAGNAALRLDVRATRGSNGDRNASSTYST